MCLGAKRSRDFFLDFSRCIIWCIDVFRRKNWPLGRRSSSHLVTGIVFPSCLRDSVCQVLTGLVAWNSVEPVWNCHFDMQKKMAKHCDYSSFSIFSIAKNWVVYYFSTNIYQQWPNVDSFPSCMPSDILFPEVERWTLMAFHSPRFCFCGVSNGVAGDVIFNKFSQLHSFIPHLGTKFR